jgi:WD40 repeat protein
VFISYSHKDDRLGRAIQSGLRRFARPWYRKTVIRTFRDETDLGVNPSLWGEIETALRNSSFFVLLASPNAATSKWVDREVEYWLAHKGYSTLLIGLTAAGIMLWDIRTHKQKTEPIKGQAGLVNGLAFSPDGRLLASGTSDGTLALWDPENAKPIGPPLNAGIKAVLTIAFSPNGSLVAAGGEAGLGLFDISTKLWREHSEIDRKGPVLALSFAPRSSLLALANSDGTLLLRDITTREARFFSPHTNVPQAIVFSSDGTQLICGDNDGALRRWNVQTGARISPDWRGSNQPLSSIAVSPADGTLLAGYRSGTIVIWDPAQPNTLAKELSGGHTAGISSLAFIPTNGGLISGGYDNHIVLWDTGKKTSEIVKVNTSTVQSIVISPDGSQFAFKGGDRRVTTDFLDKTQTRSVTVNGPPALSNLSFAEGGKTLVYGTVDGVAFVNPSDGSTVDIRHLAKGNPITSIAYDSVGDRLAASGRDGEIILLKNRVLEEGRTLSHGSNVTNLTFSPDGKLLASAGDNREIVTWRVWNRTQLWRIPSVHSGEVLQLAFSPREAVVASGGDDDVIGLYDANTGRAFGVLAPGNAAGIEALEFNRNGTLLASGGGDNSLRLWEVNLDAWKSRACGIVRRDLSESEWHQYVGKGSPVRCLR